MTGRLSVLMDLRIKSEDDYKNESGITKKSPKTTNWTHPNIIYRDVFLSSVIR